MQTLKKFSKPLAIATALLCTATFTASADAAVVRADSSVNFEDFGILFNTNTPGHVVLSYDSQTNPVYPDIINGEYAQYGVDHLSGDLNCTYTDTSTVQSRSVEWADSVSYDVAIPTANLYKCELQRDEFEGEVFIPIVAPFTPAAVEEQKLNIETVRDGVRGREAALELRTYKPNAYTTASYLSNFVYLKLHDSSNFYNYKLVSDTSKITEQATMYVLPSAKGTMRFGQLLRNGSKLITTSTATTITNTVIS